MRICLFLNASNDAQKYFVFSIIALLAMLVFANCENKKKDIDNTHYIFSMDFRKQLDNIGIDNLKDYNHTFVLTKENKLKDLNKPFDDELDDNFKVFSIIIKVELEHGDQFYNKKHPWILLNLCTGEVHTFNGFNLHGQGTAAGNWPGEPC